MVRKLKRKIRERVFEVVDVDENFNEIGKSYIENFDSLEDFEIYKLPKSELLGVENFKGEKIEKLTERFELRLSKTEKLIVEDLKQKGINVSEEIRKFILNLEVDFVKKLNREKYVELKKKYKQVLTDQTELILEKDKLNYLRGDTKEEAQFLVDMRLKFKYRIDNLERQKEKLKDYLKKYEEFFEKENV